MDEVFRTRMNDEGRLVIPAVCRKKLGLVPGQELLLRVNDDGFGDWVGLGIGDIQDSFWNNPN